VVAGLLEVHERSGALRERLRLPSEGELRIGRALDNDLILDDPYVCPHHAVLRYVHGQGWQLSDAGSVNGLRLGNHSPRLAQIDLRGRTSFRLGHTELLFRPADEALPASRADQSDHRLAQALRSVPVAMLSLLLLAATVGLQQFLGQSDNQRWLPALAEALGSLVVLALWALAWAIVNRLFAHRLQYPGHLTVAALSLLAVLLIDVIGEYLLFALAADSWTGLFGKLLLYGGLGAALWAHLGLIAGQATRRQFGAAAAVSAMLFVLFSLPDAIDDDFKREPSFQVLLKPPAFQRVDGLPVDHFYTRAAALAEAIEADLERSDEALDGTQRSTANKPQ
jgi:hypothetical protein